MGGEPDFTDDEVMWFLLEVESKQIHAWNAAASLRRHVTLYSAVLVPTLWKYGFHGSPRTDQAYLEAWHAAVSRWRKQRAAWASNPLSDPVVLGQLDDGTAFIGRQSVLTAVKAQMREQEKFERTLQTLTNVSGSAAATLGYFAFGDAGSDLGAAVGDIFAAGAQVGQQRSQFQDVAQFNLPRPRSAYVAPVRPRSPEAAGTANPGIANRGTPDRGTSRPATTTPGTSGRGTTDPGTPPRGASSPPKAPPAPPPPPATAPPSEPPPPKGGKKGGASGSGRRPPQTKEEKAAARAVSAQEAKAGKKLTPLVLAKLSHFKVDVNDAYTIKRLNTIFATNRTDDARLMLARANSGELRALIREGREPGVQSARFLRPGQREGDRTPDIEVTMRSGPKKFVEVRTVTGAFDWAQVKHAKGVRAPLPNAFEHSVEDKLRHGQISEGRPGKIVFFAPFQEVDQTALEGWREMLQGFVKAKPQADGTLGKPRPLPQGLKSIEVTGKPDREGKTRMLIFEPPGWQGRLVN